MEKIIGKYIGSQKIKEVKTSSRKTYFGNEVLRIIYENGTEEELPKEVVNIIVSDNERDLTSVREDFVKPIVEKIIAILLEAEVKIIDVDYIFQKATVSLNQNIEEAIDKLTGKDRYTRTLADIHEILIKNGKRKKTKSN